MTACWLGIAAGLLFEASMAWHCWRHQRQLTEACRVEEQAKTEKLIDDLRRQT